MHVGLPPQQNIRIPTDDRPRLIIYENPDENFKQILKFVLKNNVATDELRNCLSGVARYEPFPNINTPCGLNLHVSLF